MASACERPKKDDPPPKGTGKGKDGKGKPKGKTDEGKGKPAARQVSEATKDQENSLAKPQSEKEPDAEPQRPLTEFEKTVAKAVREKKDFSKEDTDDEVKALIASLQSIPTTKIKTARVKKSSEGQERFGILDSGATHNVRELKDEEDVRRLAPTEVLVAFDQKIKKGFCSSTKVGRLSDQRVQRR